jgi:hypothetical protein
MEIDLQGYFIIFLLIISFIPMIAGAIKRSKETEEKHLQGIRRVKEEEQEKERKRLIDIEEVALGEWMKENDDASDDLTKESETATFTFKKQTALEDVRTNYPKLTGEYEADYLEATGLDSSTALNHGNGFMIYMLLRTSTIVTLFSLKYGDSYSLFSDHTDEVEVFTITSKQGKEEKPKKRSRKITQKVKDDVWNRDGGKCVECDSNESLEFDHIIPHSKGGANTYRNIQLLCQDCNRTKSAKIG